MDNKIFWDFYKGKMSDSDKNVVFDMIEQELNCSICRNYIGHIVVKKEGESDNQIVDAINVLNKPGVIVCPTCWITEIDKRNFYRIDESKKK